MWSVSDCAVQGRGHKSKQIPCQDKTKVGYKNGTYIISLADGAGSAKLSQYGAACVVGSITELLTERFEALYAEEDGRVVKMTILEHIRTALQREAEARTCTLQELASTLLVVAVRAERYIIAHIGDGVIGYLDPTGIKVASAPSNGEHANETYFVTSKDAPAVMKLFKGECKHISGFVLMSDGTEQSLYNKRTNTCSKAIIKLMQRNILITREVMQHQLQKTFENIIVMQTQDDCSIALLSRPKGLLRPMQALSFAERCEVYQISGEDRRCKKRVERYDAIYSALAVPHTCKMLSRQIHLKPEHTKKHLQRMVSIGLIQKKAGLYYV